METMRLVRTDSPGRKLQALVYDILPSTTAVFSYAIGPENLGAVWSRGGRPELSVLTNLLVSVDVKIYCTVLRHWSQLVPNMSTDI